MKNHLKDNIFQSFLEVFEKDLPELTEAQKRKLAEKLSKPKEVVHQKKDDTQKQML